MKKPKHNPRLKAAYLDVVENQLRDNDPPEKRKTLTRLKEMEVSERDAKVSYFIALNLTKRKAL